MRLSDVHIKNCSCNSGGTISITMATVIATPTPMSATVTCVVAALYVLLFTVLNSIFQRRSRSRSHVVFLMTSVVAASFSTVTSASFCF